MSNEQEDRNSTMQRFPMIAASAALLLFASVHQTIGAEIVIPARDHAAKSPHVVSVDKGWSDLVVCHGTGGMQQWDFEVKVAGKYYLHTLYASGGGTPIVGTPLLQFEALFGS